MRANPRWPAFLVGATLMASVAACADDANPSAASEHPTVGGANGPEQSSERPDPPRQPEPATGNPRLDRPDGRHGGGRGSRPGKIGDTSAGLVELSADDIAGLLWMREEEQLAHDVYTALGEAWDLRIFSRIAASERRHVGGVVRLLEQFDIDDPMADRPAGRFTIPAVQQLFDELVIDGRESLVDALEVGALIEEIDIVDLRARATEVTDVQRLYARLEQGSHQHLRAFVGQLDARGVGYEPTRLDAATYAEIVSDG